MQASRRLAPVDPAVHSLKLNHMVSAENWFLNYVLSIGSTIDGILIKNDRRLEAEYTVLDGGTSYNVRASAQVSGSKIVVGEYMVPSDYAEQEHDQLGLIAPYLHMAVMLSR